MTDSAIATGDVLDISLNDTKQPERTFIGEIVIDTVEPARVNSEKDSGYQWHLAVKPLSFTLRSQTGAFHCWPGIKYSTDKSGNRRLVTQGEFGRVSAAIREVFKTELTRRGMELRKQAVAEAQVEGRDATELAKRDPLDFLKVGQGHFLGLQGEFVMRTLEYGDAKKGQVYRGGRESIIALRAVKPEEVAGAQAQATGVPVHTELEYTADQVAKLLSVMDGKDSIGYMRGLGRQGLTGEEVEAVTSGRGLQYLVDHNLVTVDAAGVVHKV